MGEHGALQRGRVGQSRPDESRKELCQFSLTDPHMGLPWFNVSTEPGRSQCPLDLSITILYVIGRVHLGLQTGSYSCEDAVFLIDFCSG